MVKFSRVAIQLAFILIIFCCKASYAGDLLIECNSFTSPVCNDNAANEKYNYLTTLTGEEDKEWIRLDTHNIVSFIKNSHFPQTTSRQEERNIFNNLFLSYPDADKFIKKLFVLNPFQGFLFVPHKLIIIYPHHHFW